MAEKVEQNPEQDITERYKSHLELQNYSPRTIKEYIRYLKHLLKKELSQEGINDFIKNQNNSMSRAFLKSLKQWLQLNFDIPTIKGRKGSKKIKYLTKEEIDKLINEYPSPKHALLIQLLFETGLRISEALDITQNNIDFNKLCIRGIGKGKVEYEVLISEETAEALLICCETLEDGEKIFSFDQANLRKHFIKNGLTIIGKRFHPHMLRHSTGTELRRKNIPIEAIKEYLRHKQLDTTLIYAETIDKEKQVNEPVRKAIINNE